MKTFIGYTVTVDVAKEFNDLVKLTKPEYNLSKSQIIENLIKRWIQETKQYLESKPKTDSHEATN